MARQALEDVEYSRIKEYILNPETTVLVPDHKEQFERVTSAAKILDKNPITKHAAELLRAKFPGLSIAQAYRDVALAKRLFNLYNNFDYDFVKTWLINDIWRSIQNCRRMQPNDEATIAKCHANLIKALGDAPLTDIDPRLIEKNEFKIAIQINNQTVNVDMKRWMQLDPQIKQEITQFIYTGDELTEDAAQELMGS